MNSICWVVFSPFCFCYVFLPFSLFSTFYFYGLSVTCSTTLQQTLINQNTIEVRNSLGFACGWPIVKYKNSKKKEQICRVLKSKLINRFKIIFSRFISSKCSKDVNSIISKSTVQVFSWVRISCNKVDPSIPFSTFTIMLYSLSHIFPWQAFLISQK